MRATRSGKNVNKWITADALHRNVNNHVDNHVPPMRRVPAALPAPAWLVPRDMALCIIKHHESYFGECCLAVR